MQPSPSGESTIGTERPHLHLIEGTRVCRKCQIEKPLTRFIVRKDRPGYAYPDCRDCSNEKRAKVSAERAKPPEQKWLKKLPPYPTLRKLYLEDGLTITQIAKKYDASRTSVWRKMQVWAPRFGDAWPLPIPDRGRRMSQSMQRRSVRSEVIIELVYEAVAKQGITLKEWAAAAGVQHSWISKCKSTKCRISKPMAIKLLTALGENPNPDLYEENYRDSPKYTGNYRRFGSQQINGRGTGQTAAS